MNIISIKSTRGFTPVILLVVVVTALVLGTGGGAYYYKIKKDKQKAVETPQPEVQQQISTTTASSSAVISEKELGHIKNVYEKNGKKYLDIDYVQELGGEDAVRAKIEDGLCPQGSTVATCFNGTIPIYWRNQNTKIRTFEISNSAVFTRASAFHFSSDGVKQTDFSGFKIDFQRDSSVECKSVDCREAMKLALFHIELEGDMVVAVKERYRP